MALYSHFDLLSFDGQWHAALGTNFEAGGDRFLDFTERLVASSALSDAARNGRAFTNPNAIFVTVEGREEFHGLNVTR